MIITLIYKKIAPFRIEIKRKNLTRFLDTNNLQIFFSYLTDQNIEYTFYPQLRAYHLYGQHCDEIIQDITEYRLDQVLTVQHLSEQ